jgi:hypothetical protein
VIQGVTNGRAFVHSKSVVSEAKQVSSLNTLFFVMGFG